MHDPKVYEDPEEFRPERFLKDGRIDPHVRDPYSFVFGFGRRFVIPGFWLFEIAAADAESEYALESTFRTLRCLSPSPLSCTSSALLRP